MSEEIKDMQQETDIAPVLSFDTGFEDAPAAPEVTLAPVVSENNALTPQEMLKN